MVVGTVSARNVGGWLAGLVLALSAASLGGCRKAEICAWAEPRAGRAGRRGRGAMVFVRDGRRGAVVVVGPGPGGGRGGRPVARDGPVQWYGDRQGRRVSGP